MDCNNKAYKSRLSQLGLSLLLTATASPDLWCTTEQGRRQSQRHVSTQLNQRYSSIHTRVPRLTTDTPSQATYNSPSPQVVEELILTKLENWDQDISRRRENLISDASKRGPEKDVGNNHKSATNSTLSARLRHA